MSDSKFPTICGFNTTSEAGDKPLAMGIFLFGCNLRCPFCMNGRIVVKKPEDLENPVKTCSLDSVRNYFTTNPSNWIMISGGEPFYTNPTKLINLLKEFRGWGANIGVSTNGSYPKRLMEMIEYIDYVTMDFKSPRQNDYNSIDSEEGGDTFSNMLETLDFLRRHKKNIDTFGYELRTSLYPEFIRGIDDIVKISDYIDRSEKWVLQPYRHAKNMLDEKRAKAQAITSEDEINNYLLEAKKHIDNVTIRFV
jgi:pyruvate formate lyase activating enzyme